MGGTGQGKTSLLEAIYLAATTRSFRTSRLSDCLRRASGDGESAEAFVVGIEVETGKRTRLELGWSQKEGSWRRLNGDRSSLEEHVGAQPILAFSSADIDVLVAGPDLRRRLVDRVSVASRPGSLSTLSRFRRVLEHKRALLAAGPRSDRAALGAFNELVAEAAEELILQRLRTLRVLRGALRGVGQRFQRADFDVDLRYRSSPPLGEGVGVEEDEDPASGWSGERFARELSAEIAAGRPLLGPHRDRIDVLFRGRPVAEMASAGERKAVGLLLLAAQARVLAEADRESVLLIDDIDTEMDQPTLEAVWPLLCAGPQVLVSSNRESVFSELGIDFRWSVENGSVGAR